MGIAATVTTTNGTHLRMRSLLSPGEVQRKRRLWRKLSRQKKGSNRQNRKRGLNRAISSQSWSFFRQRLEDKAANASSPVVVVAVNPRFTSQTCSQCESIAAKNRKNQAVFACVACGYEADADVNAARNILAAGLGPLWGVTGLRGTPQAKAIRAKHSGPMKRQPPEGAAA